MSNDLPSFLRPFPSTVDWSILKNYDVYILPDDDQKKYPSGRLKKADEIMPDHEQPGIKAALKIKEQLPEAKIIKPIKPATPVTMIFSLLLII